MASVPTYEKQLSLDNRHTEYASRIGQAIQKISHVDAPYIDFMLRSTLGYYGTEAVRFSNIGRKNTSDKPGLKDIGFFRDYPADNSVDVQRLVTYAAEKGKTSSKAYKKFRAIVTIYFTAKTVKQREQLADDMIDYSKELLTGWKAGSPNPRNAHEIVTY